MRRLALLLLLCMPTGRALAQDGVTVTFLANEGVLLASRTQKVLIDGLFLKYRTEFALPADSTQAALQRARMPFDAVDAVLVTHRHGDHFHPAPVVAHLRANSRATLLASRQTMDSLRGRLASNDPVTRRLVARTTPPGTVRREVVNGVPIHVLGLRHTGGWRNRNVEALGFIVDIGGRRVLHVGDAEITEATVARFRLDTLRIDVALLPHWVVASADGQAVIRRWIRPRQVVAFHLPQHATTAMVREVQAASPGAVTFTRSLDVRRW